MLKKGGAAPVTAASIFVLISLDDHVTTQAHSHPKVKAKISLGFAPDLSQSLDADTLVQCCLKWKSKSVHNP